MYANSLTNNMIWSMYTTWHLLTLTVKCTCVCVCVTYSSWTGPGVCDLLTPASRQNTPSQTLFKITWSAIHTSFSLLRITSRAVIEIRLVTCLQTVFIGPMVWQNAPKYGFHPLRHLLKSLSVRATSLTSDKTYSVGPLVHCYKDLYQLWN